LLVGLSLMAKATPKMALVRQTRRAGGCRPLALMWLRVYIIHNY
jgi:hypothetical protein